MKLPTHMIGSKEGSSQAILDQIDEFIPSLPIWYRSYACLIRSIAIDPEYALSLHVRFIEDLWERHGFLEATRFLSSVPPSKDAPYLLVTENRGRRRQTLQRNGIPKEINLPKFSSTTRPAQ
jgi:hypothetical protein